MNKVIEDWEGFCAHLAAQPFCQWTAQKQREVASGISMPTPGIIAPTAPKKNDNADLAAALSMMA